MSSATNWSMSEDVQLCISYCRQSVDPISGNKQKVDKLWEKVHADFQANWVMDPDEIITSESRTQTALSSRFAKLKKNLILWGACLAYARRNPESGTNLQDEVRKAQTMYVAQRKKTFIHFECWEQVKTHQTFAPVQPTVPPAQPIVPPAHTYNPPPSNDATFPVSDIHINATFDDACFSTPESNLGGSSSPVRPMGVKAAKEAKRKGKRPLTLNNAARDEALQAIAENKKKQLAFQEKQLALAREQMEYSQKMQQHALNAKRVEDEDKIMQMNTEIMTPKSKRYFSRKKAAILRRFEEEDALNDQGNNSADYSDCYRPSHYD